MADCGLALDPCQVLFHNRNLSFCHREDCFSLLESKPCYVALGKGCVRNMQFPLACEIAFLVAVL